MMGGVEFYYFQTRDYVVFPADNNVNMSPVDRAVRAGDYYGYLDYDYTQVWYQGNKLQFFFFLETLSPHQPLSDDSHPVAGETVELGLAICLPVLVLLVFLGSVG